MDRPKGWLMATTINFADEQEISTDNTMNFSSGTGHSGFSDYNYGAIPLSTTAIDLSTLTTSSIIIGNISGAGVTTGTGYTIANGGVGHANAVWTTTGTGSVNWNQGAIVGGYHNPAMEVNQGGKLALSGDNADIDINGKSLVRWMQGMEERMNWMQPNVELEKEWDDLKKLGDRYRKLEQKCKEKAEMWKKLKLMPQPKIR
jgi:hypothetical protein